MDKLTKEQLRGNMQLVRAMRANKQGDEFYDALKDAWFLATFSNQGILEYESASYYYKSMKRDTAVRYELPDGNLLIDLYISNKSYKNDNKEATNPKYHAKAVNFEEIVTWDSYTVASGVSLYIRIFGAGSSEPYVLSIGQFLTVHNYVYPAHYYDMYAKKIGQSIDWKAINVFAYGGTLQVQKNLNTLYLAVWTHDVDLIHEHCGDLVDALKEELAQRKIINLDVQILINPSKEGFDKAKEWSGITSQIVDVDKDEKIQEKNKSSTSVKKINDAPTDLIQSALLVKKQVFKKEFSYMIFYEILLLILCYFRTLVHMSQEGNPTASRDALIITVIIAPVLLLMCYFISRHRSKKAYKAYINAHS